MLAIVVAVSAALAGATDSLGFLFAFGLQTIFFWAIFLYRKQITGRLVSATTGGGPQAPRTTVVQRGAEIASKPFSALAGFTVGRASERDGKQESVLAPADRVDGDGAAPEPATTTRRRARTATRAAPAARPTATRPATAESNGHGPALPSLSAPNGHAPAPAATNGHAPAEPEPHGSNGSGAPAPTPEHTARRRPRRRPGERSERSRGDAGALPASRAGGSGAAPRRRRRPVRSARGARGGGAPGSGAA